LRYAVLGDIHANLPALEAVMAEIRELGVERVLCVGDIVGYGANPVECVEMVRELDATVVAGNHDWAVLNKIDVEYFNADARDSVQWTLGQLSTGHLSYLGAMELVETVDGITLAHSSPFAPEYFDYIQTLYDVRLAFQHTAARLTFVGHSHWPLIFPEAEPLHCFLPAEYELPDGVRAVVNVGSVGQPRDSDPRASYAVYDSEERKIWMRRTEYDIFAAAEQILAAGLPPTNAVRLELGR